MTGRRSLTLKGQARRVETDMSVYEHHASDFLRRKFQPTVLEVKAGHTPELIRHQGEEFIYVLQGAVEFISEFYEPTVLRDLRQEGVAEMGRHGFRDLCQTRKTFLDDARGEDFPTGRE